MATKIMTLEKFLKVVQNSVSGEQAIVLSEDISSLEIKKRLNSKRIAFDFCKSTFKSEGIGHFATGKTPVYSFAITPVSELSEEAKNLLK